VDSNCRKNRRSTFSPEDQKVLESWLEHLAQRVADACKTPALDGARDLKRDLRKLPRRWRSLLNTSWTSDTYVAISTLQDSVRLQIAKLQFDLRAARDFERGRNRIETERLWIMSVLAARLRKGDRYQAVQQALANKGEHREAASINMRVRRFLEKQLRHERRQLFRRALLSHFHPPSLDAWIVNHPGEPLPLRLSHGQWVFAGFDKSEEAVLERLTETYGRAARRSI
jgi:hypothetical protein